LTLYVEEPGHVKTLWGFASNGTRHLTLRNHICPQNVFVFST